MMHLQNRQKYKTKYKASRTGVVALEDFHNEGKLTENIWVKWGKGSLVERRFELWKPFCCQT